VVYKTYGGDANVEFSVPISEDSRFQIYSASKLFFNVALMQLIESDRLDPNDLLNVHLDQLPEDWLAG